MKKKILFIPHHPNFRELRIRLAELAQQLAGEYEVYLLDWHSSFGSRGILARAGASLKDLFRVTRITRLGGDMNIVELPLLHRPLSLAHFFNTLWLKRFIKRQHIDVVVNGSYYLFMLPWVRPYRYVVDLADLPHQGRTPFDHFIEDRLCNEITGADSVSVSSQGLVSYVNGRYGATPVFIPNGADLARYRDIDPGQIQSIRARYGLEGKWVISHIGYLGAWVDIDFLVRVFRKLRADIPEAALWIVGGAPSLGILRKHYADKNIIFTGPVAPDDIPKYFQASDIGVLPNKKSMFQDLAFHIKLVEFSGARKFVVSSDLEEVKKTGYPNVFIAPLEVGPWVDLLKKARTSAWQAAWDAAISRYDWKNIADEFKKILECR